MKEKRESVCSHLEQVLTQIVEDLIQALIGQIYIAESEYSHRGEHLDGTDKHTDDRCL